ncbi:MAG: glycosyltransferase family 39 protein, partial [Proteobacteria bacterium]|nr:glycosyltransferase family 39 protein [Pseudomonadota bacterium]
MRIRGLPILNKMFSKITKQNADKIFLISFLLLGSIQFLILQNNPFDLSPDETHYWEWSKRLDLSYYSKGPLIAYLIRIGTAIFGDTELGVRFPSFVLHQIFLICFYLFARRLYSPGIAVSVWFAVRAMLIFSQMGMLMTTDAPAALSWLLALMAIYEVIVEKRKDAWIYFSLAVGVGILAKYTVASLYLSVLLIFIFDSRQRKLFFSWQFVFSLFLLLFIVSPVFIWNYQHNWVNFSHNSGHLVKAGEIRFAPKYFFQLILGQLGLVSPVFFYLILLSTIKASKIWVYKVRDERLEIFLISFLPLFVLLLLLSFTKSIYANWPLPLYIGGLLLVAELAQKNCFPKLKAEKLYLMGLILSFFITALVHLPFYGFSLGLPATILPTKRLVGWHELSKKVAEQFVASEGLDNYFILTEDYQTASELAFYTKRQLPVFCSNFDDRRMNQYDIWGGFAEIKGRDAIVILKDLASLD